ncbi:MAG: Na+:solute symporter [Ignavibacteriae bacterium]|nr:Na+:solute symporter [Ignavibacteriota bacterium]
MDLFDWILVGIYFAGTAVVGFYFSKRAGRNTQEFFLGGRRMTWWLAGLSMVATTFAADTPLAVTELVSTHGVSGNWLWWNMLIGGMLTVFFFARLWHRSGVLTDLELIELRYSGAPAAVLRAFRSVYLGLFMNTVIMGWVNLAMAAVLEGFFGLPRSEAFLYTGLALVLTAVYSSMSGLWGVAVTDAVQFLIAMTGCIVLAVLVVNAPQIGGLAGLRQALPPETLSILPRIGSASDGAVGVLSLSAGAFLAYVGVQWWASWYPGAEPGGGGYVAQRMMSTRSEKDSVFAVLFFQIAHYALRPWPWILVGLATIILYPQLPAAEKKLGYIYAMRDFLPSGFRGLMIAAFFAAYMSTIATHLNWGTSYIVNDFWRRFVQKGREEKSYVRISRIATIGIMVLSMAVTSIMTSISDAWIFIIECGAGLGLVLILRWYWWRVNAWSEIAATLTPIITYGAIALYNAGNPEAARILFPNSLFLTAGITTVVWITLTFLTPATERSVLDAFYLKVRPGGPFWKPVEQRCGAGPSHAPFGRMLAAWVSGILLVYSALFSVGEFLIGTPGGGAAWAGVSLVSAFGVFFAVRSFDT